MSAPTSIGRYRLLEKLGEGGMGVVYAAHDDRLDRRIAIKMLRAGDAEGRARMWREARAAATVSHPNICQLYEVVEEGGDLYLAMELLEGESLAARIARSPLPLAEAVPLTLAILDALEALHRRQVIHRDLKPTNVFLTEHGVKLLDFGLARSVAKDVGDLTLTQAGFVVGTPRYMAPEQWRGDAADARTDVFATGTLLFEMLAGRPAFGGEIAPDIYHAVLHEQPPALAGTGAVGTVDVALRKALAKRREDRYDSAAAMAAALRQAMAQGHGASTGTTPVRTLTRLIVLPFRLLRPDADIDFLGFSLPDAVTTSLSGLGSLVVRSSHAAARFAGEAVDLKRVAAEADVDAVLLGTLMRAGDRVRVSAQLVEAPAGTIVWSKTVQAAMQDLFQVQDQLAHDIVESLAIPLSSGERKRLESDAPANARAYEFYLRANQVAQRSDLSGLQVARDLYRSALAEDPHYAPAWARFARACRVIAKYGAGAESVEHLRLAEEAFRHALELSPDLPLAHALVTHLEVENGRARDALRRLLGRARTQAADPDLYVGLCVATRYGGLMEASLAAHAHAVRLDPNARTSVMYTRFLRGEWEQTLALDTERLFGAQYVLPMIGREAEALARYHEMLRDNPPPGIEVWAHMMIAAIERDAGACREAAEAFLSDRLGFNDPEGVFFVARALAHVGELDAALRALERVVERGFTCPEPWRIDPWLDPIRGDPRFAALLERAEEGRRAALQVYRNYDGERVLGISER